MTQLMAALLIGGNNRSRTIRSISLSQRMCNRLSIILTLRRPAKLFSEAIVKKIQIQIFKQTFVPTFIHVSVSVYKLDIWIGLGNVSDFPVIFVIQLGTFSWEKNCFSFGFCPNYLFKMRQKIGQDPPPPHLDKIQKNSSFFLGERPCSQEDDNHLSCNIDKRNSCRVKKITKKRFIYHISQFLIRAVSRKHSKIWFRLRQKYRLKKKIIAMKSDMLWRLDRCDSSWCFTQT